MTASGEPETGEKGAGAAGESKGSDRDLAKGLPGPGKRAQLIKGKQQVRRPRHAPGPTGDHLTAAAARTRARA